jgi:glycosyltransferase involved in cell wall biosynthesis
VLRAAAQLRDRPDIAFLLVGDGAERERLVALREEMALENVVMLPQQPKSRMPELWAVSDASLVVLKQSPLFETVIPSKIFESMAMGKPIVLGVRGEASEIIAEGGAGIAIEPENATALAAAVAQLAAAPSLTSRLGESGQRYVAANFDRRVLAKRFETTLASLVTPAPHPVLAGERAIADSTEKA